MTVLPGTEAVLTPSAVEVRSDQRRSGDRDVRWMVPIATLFAAWYGVFIARTSFRLEGKTGFTLFDDAMVSMRYARNLADGHGLVWNAGATPVEGISNPLWTAWMAVLHLFPVDEARISLLVMLTSLGLLIANLEVVRRIARTLTPDSVITPVVAVVLTGCFYPLVFWSLRGMEVGLLVLLVDLGILLALRVATSGTNRPVWLLAVVIAAALLTRSDALIPCAVVTAYAVLASARARRKRIGAICGGTIVAVIGASTLARLAYYGDPLPNTYYLKLTGVSLRTRFDAGASALARNLVGSGGRGTLLVAFVVAGFAFLAWRRDWRVLLLLWGVVIGQLAYSVFAGGDAWESIGYANRYLCVAAPALFLLAALGVHQLGQRMTSTALTAVFAVGISLVLLVAVDAGAIRDWVDDNAALAAADAYGARIGVAERHATRRGAVIAVKLAGNSPYFSHRYSVDLLGKSDGHIAHLPADVSRGFLAPGGFRPGHNKSDFDYSVRTFHPDLLEWANYSWQHLRPGAPTRAFPPFDLVLDPNGYAVKAGSKLVDAAAVAGWKHQAGWRSPG